MSYVRSHSQYTAPDYVQNNLRKWEGDHMYLSSYDKLSEHNVFIFDYKIGLCNEKFNSTNNESKIK
jgi:hypothetical protein